MQITMKTIRIIDYENNRVYTRETPETFSDYIEQLIGYINENNSIRKYKTRSTNTEVISCILDIIWGDVEEQLSNTKVDIIARRLLNVEIETQDVMNRMGINVQKGSLIQALLYDDVDDKYMYLLAKVEHTDFIDDQDFSFKTGFSKDKKTMCKSCIFDIDDIEAEGFEANVYTNTSAKYWSTKFLELDEMKNDELNTSLAFKKLEATLNSHLKKAAPRDHIIIRNSLISYFKSHEHIDYDGMIEVEIENYQPIDADAEKMARLLERARELPERYSFDRQFNSVPTAINSRVKKIYNVHRGIEIRITDAIDDIGDTIQAYRDDDGIQYIKIKTDDDETFRSFKKE